MLGLTGSIALQVGSNQCLQKAHLRPPVFVKSAVTIIAVHHLYLLRPILLPLFWSHTSVFIHLPYDSLLPFLIDLQRFLH